MKLYEKKVIGKKEVKLTALISVPQLGFAAVVPAVAFVGGAVAAGVVDALPLSAGLKRAELAVAAE